VTHKERLLTAINHQEPDRVPICAWYTPEAEKRMLRHLGVNSDATETYHAAGGALPVLMEHDFFITWMGPCTGYYSRPDQEFTDEWGIGWRWIDYPSGRFTEMARHPLANIKDPAEFDMPDFTREDRYTGAKQMIDQHGGEYGVMAAVACTLFELAWYLRGMSQVMADMAENKDFAHAYFDKLMEWIETAGRKFTQMGVDIVFIGDDVGIQNRMMISPAMFREFLKPRYARLFAEWKRLNPDVKIAFHSDGYITPIIDDLVEIGLDILNPVQPKSMDPAELKKRFGKNLTFWGTIDIQEVLPFGSPADVENEVRLRLRTVGPGGGLILSPAHNIQADVPLENIRAFYDAARKHGNYPINA
jgi:uroporphyrinogen decarboxylase